MSSQGTGGPSQHHGMKARNTTDPRAKDPIQESAGPIASDSLAAESYNAGGEFADNRNGAPSGVTGEASTFNTTDTSAAKKLDAAPESGDRDDGYTDDQKGPGGVKYAEGLGGQPDFPGATTASGYSGGPTGGSSYSGDDNSTSTLRSTGPNSKSGNNSDNDFDNSGSGDNSSSGTGNNSSSTAGTAPTYVADVYLGDSNKPKGKNLIEDENLEGSTKTDFEIGSKNDPGRAALQDFQATNASLPGQFKSDQSDQPQGSRFDDAQQE